MAERSYSAKERKAYHMGRAYAAAKAGKRVDCPDSKTKQSFRNGVKDARSGKSGKKPARQTTNRRRYDGCSVVDEDGVIIGKLKC